MLELEVGLRIGRKHVRRHANNVKTTCTWVTGHKRRASKRLSPKPLAQGSGTKVEFSGSEGKTKDLSKESSTRMSHVEEVSGKLVARTTVGTKTASGMHGEKRLSTTINEIACGLDAGWVHSQNSHGYRKAPTAIGSIQHQSVLSSVSQ